MHIRLFPFRHLSFTHRYMLLLSSRSVLFHSLFFLWRRAHALLCFLFSPLLGAPFPIASCTLSPTPYVTKHPSPPIPPPCLHTPPIREAQPQPASLSLRIGPRPFRRGSGTGWCCRGPAPGTPGRSAPRCGPSPPVFGVVADAEG